MRLRGPRLLALLVLAALLAAASCEIPGVHVLALAPESSLSSMA